MQVSGHPSHRDLGRGLAWALGPSGAKRPNGSGQGCLATLPGALARPLLLKAEMSSSTAARIDRLQRQAAAESDVISLGGGLPDPRLFPKQDLGDAFFRALHRPGQALQYGWPEGELELREWIAARLRRAGASLGPENIIVTNGAQQAISLAARALFVRGQRIGLADESYPGAIEIFRTLGLDVVAWHERARGYYLMPSMDNPCGQSLAASARAHLLRRLEEEGSTLIEDDAYAESRFDGRPARPLVADAPKHVIHVGTLSKVLCPGLRVGWLATKHPAFSSILGAKQQDDLQAPSLTQRIVSEYLNGPRFDHHLVQIRGAYERKAKLLLEAVLEALPDFRVEAPRGGFSLWLEYRAPEPPIDDLSLLDAALREGVSFDPGRSFRIRESKQLALRVCYGAVPEEQIECGVARLARALQTGREAAARSRVRWASPTSRHEPVVRRAESQRRMDR